MGVAEIVYVSGGGAHLDEIASIINKFGDEKICYVTLNKSCGGLREALEKMGFDLSRFHFIDGISHVIGMSDSVGGCDFVAAQYELEHISNFIKKAILLGYNNVIFDSLSNLLVHKAAFPVGGQAIEGFIGTFSEKMVEAGGRAVFICNEDDREAPLIVESLRIFE